MNKLNQIEEDFIEFISIRRSRSLEEIRTIFLRTREIFKFSGVDFENLCINNHELFRLFYDDKDERGTLDSYRFHAPMHLYRFISYSYDRESSGIFLRGLKTLIRGDFKKIINFAKKKLLGIEKSAATSVVGYGNIAKLLTNYVERPVVVDYGCGLGYISFEIAKIQPSSKIYLVDIESIVSDFNLYRFRKHGINAEFIPISESNLYPDLPPHNICIATEVTEHLFEPLKFYKKMYRSLESGGILYGGFGDHEDYMFHVSPRLDSFRDRVSNDFDKVNQEIYKKRSAGKNSVSDK